jgi:hypothetical protein
MDDKFPFKGLLFKTNDFEGTQMARKNLIAFLDRRGIIDEDCGYYEDYDDVDDFISTNPSEFRDRVFDIMSEHFDLEFEELLTIKEKDAIRVDFQGVDDYNSSILGSFLGAIAPILQSSENDFITILDEDEDYHRFICYEDGKITSREGKLVFAGRDCTMNCAYQKQGVCRYTCAFGCEPSFDQTGSCKSRIANTK